LPARVARTSPLTLVAIGALIAAASLVASAAELKPRTIAAFERYQAAAEQAIATDLADRARFLRVLRDPKNRSSVSDRLRRGEVVVERLRATENGRDIDIPDGLIHHWVGGTFIAGASVAAAVSMMQAYDRHSVIFRPNVAQSRLISHDGDQYKFFLRLFLKKVITVTVNTEHEAIFTRHDPSRVSSRIRSTRIAEVENAGTPTEHERPIGNDGGFLWRFNTYWRFVEADVTLTRGIPMGVGWLIGPFVTSIPRETLSMTLEATRRSLTGARSAARFSGAREIFQNRSGLLE
jgi:hypothetical protein